MKPVLKATLLFALFLPFTVQGRPATDWSKLDALVQRIKKESGQPSGTAIVVVKGDRVVYQGYFGQADIAARKPVDRNTVFYIASATKPFMALNVLLEADRGRIALDESLQAMFPDIRFYGFDAKSVSLRNLLSHTSGIDNRPLVWATAYSGLHDAASRRRLVALSTPLKEGGLGAFKYSNVGYNVASVWLDQRIGIPWQRQLSSNIFKPLAMGGTTAYVSESRKRGHPLARPYSFVSQVPDQPLYLEKTDETMQAAGGMVATAGDLGRFIRMQIGLGSLDGRQLFPAEVIAQSQRQLAVTDGVGYQDFERKGYAWGWYIGRYKARRMLHHFGGFAGFHAHMSFMPDDNIGLVVLNNEDVLAPRLTALIADYVYGSLLAEPDIDDKVAERAEKLIADAVKSRAGFAAQREKLNARPWRLSLPMQAYAGQYRHAVLGVVEVEVGPGGRPSVRWGRLRAEATAYDERDHMRIEWVPNSGSVLGFHVEGERVHSVSFEGMTFARQ